MTSRLTSRQVASDINIGFSTLSKWIQASNSQDLPPAADVDLAKEHERLRKENRFLVEKRDIFKKATVFLANKNEQNLPLSKNTEPTFPSTDCVIF